MSRPDRIPWHYARYLSLLLLVSLVYIVLFMISVDRFFPPFDRLIPVLLPWKQMSAGPADGTITGRLEFMQGLLERSRNVSNLSLGALFLSFTLFGAFAVRIFQQQRRRSRENRLLTLKNQEIARRNEFIRHISATIGHEFKNNLARIKRRMELLPNLPPAAKDRIGTNFAKLFSDIEIFKRIADEREAGLIDFQPLDLREVLAQIAEHYGDFMETTIHGQDQVPSLYASAMLIRTVFENIFDNAVKYKKPEEARARLQVTFSTSSDVDRRYVTISIRDEGIGMSEEDADLCFYKRAGSQGGWGTGLYFSKYVVGLHAGRIGIGREYTAPGVGTEVILHLPYVEEEFRV